MKLYWRNENVSNYLNFIIKPQKTKLKNHFKWCLIYITLLYWRNVLYKQKKKIEKQPKYVKMLNLFWRSLTVLTLQQESKNVLPPSPPLHRNTHKKTAVDCIKYLVNFENILKEYLNSNYFEILFILFFNKIFALKKKKSFAQQ